MKRFTAITAIFAILTIGCFDLTARDFKDTELNGLSTFNHFADFSQLTEEVCDTLFNFELTETPTIYGNEDGGYVSGHNSWGDLAKAEFFENSIPGGQLEAATILFGVADFSSSTASVTVNVWEADPNGQPGSVLASQDITIESIDAAITAEMPVLVTFPNPPVLQGDFFVGVEFSYAPGDTIAIVTVEDREEGNPNTAWEQWDDGNWLSYDDSWGIYTSHYILAVVCGEAIVDPCEGFSVELSSTPVSAPGAEDGAVEANVTGGIPPYTYTWNTGDDAEDLSDVGVGTYSVTVTDDAECEATASTTVGVFSSVEELDKSIGMRAYPNPAHDVLTISFERNLESASIQIYNVLGKTVKNFQDTNLTDELHINVQNLVQGVYFIKIYEGNEEVGNASFVVQ